MGVFQCPHIKAVKGDFALDKKISERMRRKSVTITQSDMDFMGNVLETKKNGGYYSNDRELLFALLCHYKYAELNDSLIDGCLQITKRKHATVTKNGQKKKVPIRYNMNAIMNMVGATSYAGSFKRFVETGLVSIEEAGAVRVKMNISYTDSEKEAFIVEDIYNPYVYLLAYEQGRKLTECVICGKHFIKESNNQKTCNKSCSIELQKFNMAKNNEKLRAAALDAQKAI